MKSLVDLMGKLSYWARGKHFLKSNQNMHFRIVPQTSHEGKKKQKTKNLKLQFDTVVDISFLRF